MISYRIARLPSEFATAKNLFLEYAHSLSVDLGFQEFDKELENIRVQYDQPGGALLIVYDGEVPVGCAGLRKLDPETAELKRMYVKPEFRNKKIGRALLERVLNLAGDLNYRKVRLDTLPEMRSARGLYRDFGFYEIPAYCFNPVPGTVYLEKMLL